MRNFNCILIFLVCCVLGGYCEEPSYTTRYDNVDLDEILKNDRLLSGYVNCLLELGPCTPDGKELKNNLPDAIDNDCVKCSEKQRIGSEKVMHYIIDHRPKDWEALEKKYNSDGSYKRKYMEKKKSDEKDDTNADDDDDDDDDDDNDGDGDEEESKMTDE